MIGGSTSFRETFSRLLNARRNSTTRVLRPELRKIPSCNKPKYSTIKIDEFQ